LKTLLRSSSRSHSNLAGSTRPGAKDSSPVSYIKMCSSHAWKEAGQQATTYRLDLHFISLMLKVSKQDELI